MNLEFTFELKENPYSYEISSKFEIWGQIKLSNGSERIIDHQWDILEVINWFFETRSYLLHEKPIINKPGYSIAQLRDYLYDNTDFSTSIEYIEELENYFSNHTFHLRGTSCNFFYIGLNSNFGELSYREHETYYSYNFDMKIFLTNTFDNIYKLIEYWNSSEFKTKEALLKIKEIEKQYNVTLL